MRGVDHRFDAGHGSAPIEAADRLHRDHIASRTQVFVQELHRREIGQPVDEQPPGRRPLPDEVGDRLSVGVDQLVTGDEVGQISRHVGDAEEHLAPRLVDVDAAIERGRRSGGHCLQQSRQRRGQCSAGGPRAVERRLLPIDLDGDLGVDQFVERHNRDLGPRREVHAPAGHRPGVTARSVGAATGADRDPRDLLGDPVPDGLQHVVGGGISGGGCGRSRHRRGRDRSVEPEADNEHGDICPHLGVHELIVQLGQQRLVQVDAVGAVLLQIGLAGEDGEVRIPPQIEQPVLVVRRRGERPVVLVRIEQAVAVGVLAIEQCGRDAADEQQLVDRFTGSVLGAVRRLESLVSQRFGPVGPLLVVRVDPIEDAVRRLIGHPRYGHQQGVRLVLIQVERRDGVDVDLRRLIDQPVPQLRARRVVLDRSDQRKPPAPGVCGRLQQRHSRERFGVVIDVLGLQIGGVAEHGSCEFDARVGQRSRLSRAGREVGSPAFEDHGIEKRVSSEGQQHHDDQHHDEGTAAAGRLRVEG